MSYRSGPFRIDLDVISRIMCETQGIEVRFSILTLGLHHLELSKIMVPSG